MSQATLARNLKQAIAAALRENRGALRDLLAETIEDVSLASAIREGMKTKPLTRKTVFKALKRRK
jgi:aspartokinase